MARKGREVARSGLARRPGRVTAGEPDDAIEQRRLLRHVDHRAEQPGAHLLLPWFGELRYERAHGLERGRVAVVGLARGSRDVPPVDHDLVQRDEPGDLAGQLDATS